MRALYYTRYGPPEVLRIAELPKPSPQAGELLIKVHATTVNRTDTGMRSAEYFVSRFFTGLLRPKPSLRVLGSEFSGVIEAVGADVHSFKIGDAVFGLSTATYGAHAEYLCLPENGTLAPKPANLSHAEAASTCEGLMLSIAFLRAMKLGHGQRLLVNGASGSIGSAALQLARHFGASVTVTGQPRSLDLLRSLGAERVIDYTTTDFTQCGEIFDCIFDAVGKSTFFRCQHLLKPGGCYASTEFGPYAQNPFLALASHLFGGLREKKRVHFPIPAAQSADIDFFRTLLETGEYRPVIDRTYAFAEIIDAVRYVEKCQKLGNVAVVVFPG